MSIELHLWYIWSFKLHHFVWNKRFLGHLVGSEQQEKVSEIEVCHISKGFFFSWKESSDGTHHMPEKETPSFISRHESWIWNFKGKLELQNMENIKGQWYILKKSINILSVDIIFQKCRSIDLIPLEWVRMLLWNVYSDNWH